MTHTRETIIALIEQCRKDDTRIDLHDEDLQGLDLTCLNLQKAYLRGAYLQEANLRWANLQGAYLRGAYLQEAYLRWANLQGANLQGAYLRGAYLQEANLDYCGFNLSCKTIDINADKRLVSQLLYHLCRMNVSDCPEWDELRNDERIIALANQSHVIPVHGLRPIEKETKE